MLIEFLSLIIFGYVAYHSSKSRPKTADKIPNQKNKEIGNLQRKEILFEGRLYDVTNWANKHPGGRVIEFYVNNNEDASLAIQQFHLRSSKKVSAIMSSLPSRPAPAVQSSIDGEQLKTLKYEELTRDFGQLFKQFQAEGLFEPSLIYVGIKVVELVSLGTVGLYIALKSDSLAKTAAGILVLNLYQLRTHYFMHEGGHNSLTGRPGLDRLLQSVAYGIGVGFSGGWWRSQHNRHHAMPQRLNHDVDLNTLPLIAFNVAVTKGHPGKPNLFLRHQAKLLVPISSFLGFMGWKLHLHPQYSIRKKQYLELALISFHYYFAFKMGLLPYIVLTMLNASSTLVNFFISHSHLPVTEEPRHWVEYSTIHTMNVNPSWWCDYWLGFLNYQIEHHLFPTLPQFRLHLITKRVKALIEKHNLPYTCTSYGTAVGKMFSNLSSVSHALEHHSF